MSTFLNKSDDIDKFWDNKSEQEKEQIQKELDDLCRAHIQKTQANDPSIKERIEDIRRKWPLREENRIWE